MIDRAAAEEALSIDGIRLYTAEKAAAKRQCHPETVKRAIRAGELPARKVGGMWLIAEKDLAAWSPRPVGRPGREEE